MMNTVFVHTNEKQMVGALVSVHSMKRNSKAPHAFEAKIIRTEDYPMYRDFHGKSYLREGRMQDWDADDLQSFTTTRFMPPKLMGYQGRSVVIDPDVFAVGDVNQLFQRNMQGKAVMARNRAGHKGYADYIATSVMLLDNTRLTHWDVEKQFPAMFEGQLDYEKWMRLANEDRSTIGVLEDTWNDFDNLGPNTQMLHNTKRRTQPWKTGLAIDYTNRWSLLAFLPTRWTPAGWIKRSKMPGKYWKHPDTNQEAYFFALAREALEAGVLSRDILNQHIALGHVRADAPALIAAAMPVDDVLERARKRAA